MRTKTTHKKLLALLLTLVMVLGMLPMTAFAEGETEPITSFTLELLTDVSGMEVEVDDTVVLQYKLTNTGNTQFGSRTCTFLNADGVYKGCTFNFPGSNWYMPNESTVFTITFSVDEDDISHGNVYRKLDLYIGAYKNMRTGVLCGFETEPSQIGDTFSYEDDEVVHAVLATTIPLAESGTEPEPKMIEAVAVTGVTAPVAGEAASLAFTVPADAGYSKQDRGDGFGIWKEFDHNPTAAEISAAVPKDLPFSFVGGNYYVFTAYVEAKEGFCFGTEAIPATMNGAPAAYEQIHSKSANVIGTFYCELPTVDSIAVESVVTPVVGEECSFGYALPTDANYEDYMDTCGWVESTTPPPASLADSEDWDDWAYNNKTDSASNGAGQSITFRAGYYYTFVLIVQPKTGYKFADSVSATVNGQTAKFLPEGSALHDRVIYTFGPLSEDGGSGEDPAVDNVAINDVVAPSVGAASDFAFSLPSGAHYTSYVEGSTDVCLWVESDTAPGSLADSAAWNTWCGSNQTALARPMDTPISFQSGKYYTFLVCVEPEDGYAWADTVSATVNGETAQFLKAAGEFVDCVIYTFGPLSEDGGSGEDPTTPETDTVLIPLWKNVAGAYAPAEEFSFSVVDGNNQPFEGPVVTGNTIRTEGVGSYSGLITITGTAEEIDRIKQSVISIKEESKSGWDCDETEYIVKWHDGAWYMFDMTGIEVISSFEDYGAPLEQLEFTNTYVGEDADEGGSPSSVECTVNVTKIVEGENAPNDAVFTFMLSDENAVEVDTATITGAGNGSFKPLSFTEPGTYVYMVKEVEDGTGAWEYDGKTVTVTVQVSMGTDGLKIDSILYSDGTTISGSITIENPDGLTPITNNPGNVPQLASATFTNTYTGGGDEPGGSGEGDQPAPVEYSVPVTKHIEGENAPADAVFTFELSDGDNSTTVQITGEGTARFAPLRFTEEGTYYYTVEEQNGGLTGWTYDDSIVSVAIEVLAAEDSDANPILKIESVIYTVGNDRVDGAIFTNIYNADDEGNQPGDSGDNDTPTTPERPLDPNVPKTGDNGHLSLWIALMFVAGIGVVATTVLGKKRKGKYSK